VLRAFLGGTVFGEQAGEGPPRVLLLHGWRRTHADLAGDAGVLAAHGVASIALDLAGFGATPPPPVAMGAKGYAEDLEALLAELAGAAGPLVVVGHSFGGRVGVSLAARRPELVAGLVLSGVPLVRSAMPAGRTSRRYQLVRAAARWHLVSPARLEASRRRHGSSDYRAASGVMRDVLVATINESYEPELLGATCPVRLVWGALDATAPISVARAALEVRPDATLEALEGIGHLVPTESPGALARSSLALLGAAT
jgi:pimeloyl-ACP methyl ester carboxylesterase